MSPHQKRIMENNAIFEEVRLLLREDDPAGALHLLIEKLKDNDAFDEVVRTLRVIETEVHSAKQNERKGILTYHDARQIFSKAIDSIHGIIDDLERGRAPQTGHLADTAPAPTTSSSSRKALVAIFSLLVMVVAGWVWFKKSDQPPITKTSPDRGKTDVCPAYTREGVRVLILPFQSFGSETDKPELAFQTQIRDLTGRNNLPSMVEVYRGTLQANSTPDIEKAAQIGRNCGADLVIWGQYDRSRDALKIDTRYVFTQTSRSGKTSFQSVPDLPALTLLRQLLEERTDLRVGALAGSTEDRKALRDLDKQVMSLMGDLGFNPAARARLGLAEVKAQSKLDELRQRQAAAGFCARLGACFGNLATMPCAFIGFFAVKPKVRGQFCFGRLHGLVVFSNTRFIAKLVVGLLVRITPLAAEKSLWP